MGFIAITGPRACHAHRHLLTIHACVCPKVMIRVNDGGHIFFSKGVSFFADDHPTRDPRTTHVAPFCVCVLFEKSELN